MLAFFLKETNFVSYTKFLEGFKVFFKDLTARKAKRMSKAYFITISKCDLTRDFEL